MSRMKLSVFITAGLAVALALAFFVSPEASSSPDGLNKVAIDEGFADQEEAHALEDSPLAGYAVEGVDDERLSTGLSGVIGVTITFAVAGGGLLLLRQVQRRRGDAGVGTGSGAGPGAGPAGPHPEPT
jgi:cobalt/nickel transport protein